MMSYLRKVIFLLFLCMAVVSGFAQAPGLFNYQAVVRDSAGMPLADSLVQIKISVLKDSIQGTVVFEEEHSVTTDMHGLFSLKMGNGMNATSSLDSIHWAEGEYYVKTEVDLNASGSYQEISTTQLLSVPYALHANTADSLIGFDKNNKYDLPSGTIIKTSNPNDTNLLNNGFVLTNISKDNSTPLAYTGNPNDSIEMFLWSLLGKSDNNGSYIQTDFQTHQFYFDGKFYLVYPCNGKIVEFHPNTGNYSFLEPSFPSSWSGYAGGCSSSSVWTGSNLFVFENPSDTTSNPRLLKYTPLTNSWSSVPLPTSLGDRLYPEMRFYNGKILIVGGFDWGSNNYTNFIETYNYSSNTWISASTTNAPSARYNHTATIAGDKLIVWGGADLNGNELSDGYIYDLSNNSWSPMATSPLTARQRVVNVWTGNEVVIVGGVTQTDGALFNPNSNTWSTMATSNLPAGPTNAYAFDGKNLIVTKHAGATGSHLYQKTMLCSLYSPAGDVWKDLSGDYIPYNYQGNTVHLHNNLVVVSPSQIYSIGYIYENNSYKIGLHEFNSVTINGVSSIGSSQNTWIYTYTKQ